MTSAISSEVLQSIIWEPQPQQAALISCPVFEVFFGGARGGGKTDASIGDWIEHSNTYGENAVGIFVRRKLKQLDEVIARTKQLFTKLGATFNVQQKTWTMPNGARLKFVYLEKDSDAEEYQGHNYTRVYIEEVTNFPSPSPINKLRATLRSTAGVPVGMRLTGNPGGPGHNWVKARYISPNPKGYEIFYDEETIDLDGEPTVVKLGRVFIPSKLADNQLLLRADPTYVLRLRQSGSEALVNAWLKGDWDIVDGAFFDEWDDEKHILPSWVGEKLPRNALRFRAHDWGSAKPFSVGWYCMLPEPLDLGFRTLPKGALIKYREWYGAKGPNVGIKMTADQVAEGILLRERGERISYGVADPAIFIRNGGPSIGETMAVKGCSWRSADNKRKPGAEELRRRLVGNNGVPMLYFLDCCEDSIRTLPVLQHDEKDPEDVDTEAEDHAYDEIRYAVMSRPWQPRHSADEGLRLPKNPQDMTIDEIIARRTAARKARENSY